jgi:[ribosomal protein S5]-alanine N-acetyltransferase
VTDAAGLTTARLALRRFTPADFEWLHGINGDAEVKRHMGGPATRAQTEALLRDRILGYYEQHPGLGIWVTLERATGAPIGFHLLNNIQGETELQVGYVLDRAYWGRGYATEMCAALLRYGFTQLALPRLHAITDQANVASQRVLLKAGLQRHGDRAFPHPAYAHAGAMAFFQRDAQDWLAQFGDFGA